VTDTGTPWGTRDVRATFPLFTDLPSQAADGSVVIERGEGCYVFDTEGRRYFEGNSGLWNVSLGFSEHRLAAAAARQYAQFPGYHSFFGRNSRTAVLLAERMLELAPVPMGRVFFTNSGSEANDSVAKLLWFMWRAEGQPQRRKLLYRRGAYHGSTVLASSLTGKDYIRAFGLPMPECIELECPHLWRHGKPGESEQAFTGRLVQNLEAVIAREGAQTIAGFWAEPVMGAGGVIVPPAGYFAAIQPVLARHGIPIVADEVICGFGRTGHLWGSQAFGLEPDIIVASKSMSAGYFPVGAVMLSKELDARAIRASHSIEEFPHGHTTGGHPVGAAVSLEAIRIITEEGVIDHVREVSRPFWKRLAALQASHPIVGEARGMGLMAALEIVGDKAAKTAFPSALRVGERIVAAARRKGLIIRPLGSAVVLAPPFIATAAQLDDMLNIVEQVLDEVGREVAGRA